MKHFKNIILAFFMSLVLFSSSMATVSSEDTPRVQYTANGITTNFPITFTYAAITDVHVYFISNSTGLATAWTKDASGPTGYTVSAGAIVANTAPSNGYLVAVCTTPVTQLVDVKPNRALTADTLEGVFDKLTLIGRDLKGSVSRALIYGPTYTGSIPYAEDLADEIQQDSVDASVAAVKALTFATSLHIDNLAALRLFPGGETKSIYLVCRTSPGDGGHGTFVWSTTDLSAEVTADTQHGIYVAPDSDPTGASGAWVRLKDQPMTLEMFGAVGNGIADDLPAFKGAVAMCTGTIYGTEGKTYLLSTPLTVTKSNVGFDLRWATLKGTTNTIYFDGESLYTDASGDYSTVPSGNFFRNALVDSAAIPIFKFVRNAEMENVIKTGQSVTALNIFCCVDVSVRNIAILEGRDDGNQFGALILHSFNTVVDHLYMANGPFLVGVQVKGGRNNRINNSAVVDNDTYASGNAVTTYNFYSRGDAPHNASNTTGIKYPYYSEEATPWLVSDDNRASWGTVFDKCSVYNSAGVGFNVIESVNTTITKAAIDGVISGITLLMKGNVGAPDGGWGKEGGHIIDNVTIKNVGTLAYPGYGMFIANGTYDYGQSPAPGDAPYPVDYSPFKGIVVNNVRIEDVALDGIRVVGAQLPKFSNIRIRNCNTAGYGSNQYCGFYSFYCDGLVADDVIAEDTQAVNTTYYTMNVTVPMEETYTTHKPFTFRNCVNEGAVNDESHLLSAGTFFSGNFPADYIASSTVATPQTSLARLRATPSTKMYIEVDIFSPTLSNSYTIAGLFSISAAGAATQIGTTQVLQSIEGTAGPTVGFITSIANFVPVFCNSNGVVADWYINFRKVDRF